MTRMGVMTAAVTALALVAGGAIDACACVSGTQVASLSDGSCVSVDNVTFTVENLQLCTTCATGDEIKQDGSKIGVEVFNPTGALITAATNTNQDITFSLGVTGSLSKMDKVLLGITGTADPATSGQKQKVSASEYVYGASGAQLGHMVANLNAPNQSVAFAAGQTGLTLTKDLNVIGNSLTKKLTLNTVTQDLIPVPEPGSAAALAAGLVSLFAARRRRRLRRT